jgi:hypothetical protein
MDVAVSAPIKMTQVESHETFASPLGVDQPRDYLVTRAIRK